MNDAAPKTAAATVLFDLDALVDMDLWEDEVRQKRWLHFYLHASEAAERNPALRDAIELAVTDGIRVAYSSRWPEMTSYLVKPWLEQHGYPAGFINWRRSGWASPAELGALHAAAAARRGSVLFIHNDPEVASELRSRFGIAGLTPPELPQSVEGLRKVFSLARPVRPFELPKRASKKKPRGAAA